MGLFDLFCPPPRAERGPGTIPQHPGAILLDVRTPEEYRDGHLPGAKKPAPGSGWIPSPSLPGARCSSTAAAGRGAPRPKRPAGAGGVFRHRSGGPAGLPRAAGSIGREARA